MRTAEPIAHIYRDESGVLWVDNTRVKVLDLALDHVAYGWSADEMHRQHPDLTLAQIYAALGYYYDHKGTIDPQLKNQRAEAEKQAATTADSPLRQRVRPARRP